MALQLPASTGTILGLHYHITATGPFVGFHDSFLIMADRVIAIGDIHGCAPALSAIVDEIQPAASDTLVILGDCVDRGPDSAGVIDQVLALRERCHVVPLLGNHEEMMLNYIDDRPQLDDWLQCGGDATVESYRQPDGHLPPIPSAHIDYIRTWDDCFETDTHFYAHGCYEPERPLSQQHWRIMRWQSLKQGIPGPHQSGKIAIVGHSSQKTGEMLNVGHLICIDTFCFAGGWLTALEPATGAVWQADRNGRLRQT